MPKPEEQTEHPKFSVEKSFLLPEMEQRGVTKSLATPAVYNDAAYFQHAIERNISDGGYISLDRVLAGGKYRFADGTAVSPSIAFATDIDMGLYRIGSDNLGITLGAVKTWDFGKSAGVYTQQASTSGTPTAFTLTGGVISGWTAATETIDVNFNLTRSFTITAGTRAGNERAFLIQAPTYTGAGAGATLNGHAATFAVTGAPTLTNISHTWPTYQKEFSIWAQAGVSRFGSSTDAVHTVEFVHATNYRPYLRFLYPESVTLCTFSSQAGTTGSDNGAVWQGTGAGSVMDFGFESGIRVGKTDLTVSHQLGIGFHQINVTSGGLQSIYLEAGTAGGSTIFNDTAANIDFRVEGDLDANLLFLDASADAVFVGGTALLAAEKFSVTGDIANSGNLVWRSGTAFNGTFDHAITAARTWTFPDLAGVMAIETMINVGRYAGATLGAKLAAALADVTTSAILDCRGQTGAQTITGTITVNKQVQIWFGGSTITCTGSPVIDITVPGVTIYGAGHGAAAADAVTRFQAATGNTPIFRCNSAYVLLDNFDVRYTSGGATDVAIQVGDNLANINGFAVRNLTITGGAAGNGKGILLYKAFLGVVQDCYVKTFAKGLHFNTTGASATGGCVLRGNRIESNTRGIDVDDVLSCFLFGNTIQDNTTGLYVTTGSNFSSMGNHYENDVVATDEDVHIVAGNSLYFNGDVFNNPNAGRNLVYDGANQVSMLTCKMIGGVNNTSTGNILQQWNIIGTDSGSNHIKMQTSGGDITIVSDDLILTGGSAPAMALGPTPPATPESTLHILSPSAPAGILLATNQTDAAAQTGRIKFRHWLNAEEDHTLILGSAASSTSGIAYIGGGSSLENACTQVSVYTAANNTTVTGTERWRCQANGIVNNVGNLTIGRAAGSGASYACDVVGSIGATGQMRVGTATDTGTAGDAVWGLLNAGRLFFDQSVPALTLYDASNVARFGYDSNGVVFNRRDSSGAGIALFDMKNLGAALGGTGGFMNFYAYNSTPAEKQYGRLSFAAQTVTAGAEHGTFDFFATASGVEANTGVSCGGHVPNVRLLAGGVATLDSRNSTTTIDPLLRIGTATEAATAGDLVAGLTGDARMFYDQSLASWSLMEANGQQFTVTRKTELTTIAAAATTDTAITIPANAIVFAVSVRVTVAIPTAATFTVTGTTSGTQFDVAAGVSVALNTTDVGTANCPYKNGAAQAIRFTPNLAPATNAGRVRVTIHYYEITPPTS